MTTPENPLPNDAIPLEHDDSSLNTVSIPVIEEQLQVDKRTIETGRVKLTKTVHEEDETVTIPLLHSVFAIERVPINEYVFEAPATRQDENTTIYSVVKEVLVVEKRLLLIEEIRVTKQQTEVNETQTVRLRREELTVERMPGNPERPV